MVKNLEKLSLAEEQIAEWSERLKSQIPGWEELPVEAQKVLAGIAVASAEETAMTQNSLGTEASVKLAHAMRRAMSRGFRAAEEGANPEQLLIAFIKGTGQTFNKLE